MGNDVKSMTIYNLQSQGPITFYRASIPAHQYYIRTQTLSVREQEGEKTAEEREYGFGPVFVRVCVGGGVGGGGGGGGGHLLRL